MTKKIKQPRFVLHVPTKILNMPRKYETVGSNILVYPLAGAFEQNAMDEFGKDFYIPDSAVKYMSKMAIVIDHGEWFYSEKAKEKCEYTIKRGDIVICDKRGFKVCPGKGYEQFKYIRECDLQAVLPMEKLKYKEKDGELLLSLE